MTQTTGTEYLQSLRRRTDRYVALQLAWTGFTAAMTGLLLSFLSISSIGVTETFPQGPVLDLYYWMFVALSLVMGLVLAIAWIVTAVKQVRRVRERAAPWHREALRSTGLLAALLDSDQAGSLPLWGTLERDLLTRRQPPLPPTFAALLERFFQRYRQCYAAYGIAPRELLNAVRRRKHGKIAVALSFVFAPRHAAFWPLTGTLTLASMVLLFAASFTAFAFQFANNNQQGAVMVSLLPLPFAVLSANKLGFGGGDYVRALAYWSMLWIPAAASVLTGTGGTFAGLLVAVLLIVLWFLGLSHITGVGLRAGLMDTVSELLLSEGETREQPQTISG